LLAVVEEYADAQFELTGAAWPLGILPLYVG
jgi:hypothetical protein